jgi:hypothetical protein
LLLVIAAEFDPTAAELRNPIPFSRAFSMVLPLTVSVRTVFPVMLIPSVAALEIVDPETVTVDSELRPLNWSVPSIVEFTTLTVLEPLPVANVSALMNLPAGRVTTLVEHVSVPLRT